ncbi:hypothetical protein LOB22_03875 [Lactobacillus delbrueckii subsp. lactis]|nr:MULTISPECIES: hypothetical protein [Lactobacillus]MCD5490327.1 hypothetical protein [Lactobacillus delbrueckii subsp. lactis]MCD5495791.1 hypothetical protein [Lactobacillus delbrueckii subsp. lactis]MCD5497342.1 hypothetical protein [Lactobacillus delbrueckii subsp. lactis]MCD5499367.1 hypothetical protein [Lactobacillus delbrueckii subsp. lactis]MCD5502885.1 hypothetical protein [Lactobacillus delbrueckii subsp. lactis]
MQEKEELKRYLIDHLDEAIEKHYLQVYYQPVIRSRDSCHRMTLFPSLKR